MFCKKNAILSYQDVNCLLPEQKSVIADYCRIYPSLDYQLLESISTEVGKTNLILVFVNYLLSKDVLWN